MRVDLDAVLTDLKEAGARLDPLRERMERIARLEEYTLLAPPYVAEKAAHLLRVAQNKEALDFRFTNDYYWFMCCCDGGLLFTNQIFSLDDREDEDNDLIMANLYYREEGMIPKGCVCIGRTNYGAFIVIRPGPKGEMALWDMEEEQYIAEFDDLYGWLDDVLNEAEYLLETDDLPVIEDDDDEEDGEDG